MGVIEDTILDAIDIMTKSKIDNANYDKTIMAQIISCSDESTGEYYCVFMITDIKNNTVYSKLVKIDN